MIELGPILIAIVNAVLPNIAGIAFTALMAFVGPYLVKYLGNQNALALQTRLNEVMSKGISYAVTQAGTAIEKGNLSIKTSNVLAGLAARYVNDHAPELAAKVSTGLGSLEQKALARLDSHPDVIAAVTPPPAPPIVNTAPASAASQTP